MLDEITASEHTERSEKIFGILSCPFFWHKYPENHVNLVNPGKRKRCIALQGDAARVNHVAVIGVERTDGCGLSPPELNF